jgi:hypothetical protein
LARKPAKDKELAEKKLEKAPEDKVEDEYRDNEKVRYKTKVKLSSSSRVSQEDNCFVTENHVLIEDDEPIRIPLSQIKDCRVSIDIGYMVSDPLKEEPWTGKMELAYLDDLKKKRRMSFGLVAEHQFSLQKAIYRQMIGRFFDEAAEPSEKSALGEFFFKVREIFRNKTRDNVCVGLQKLGIDAHMVRRGRIEEKIGEGGSLGIIHIPEGPIRWVNIRDETHASGQTISIVYYTEYGIPDTRLGSDLPLSYIRPVRKKLIRYLVRSLM